MKNRGLFENVDKKLKLSYRKLEFTKTRECNKKTVPISVLA